MKWDDLQYVLAVARKGTLSKAASSLGVTHTTVGRRLRAIESDLNVRLFDQTTAGYVPTPAGEDIADVAEKVEADLLSLQGRVLGRDIQLQGKLRVSTVDFLFECFSGQFASFVEQHQHVELTVSISNTTVSLIRREADVALRVTNAPSPESLVGRKVADLRYAVYGSKALAERIGLNAHYNLFPWLHHDERSNPKWMNAWLAEHAPDARIALRIDGAVAARDALNAGIGLHLLPSFYAEMNPNLVQVGSWSSTVGLWLLTLPELRTNRRVCAFTDQMYTALRSRLQASPLCALSCSATED